MLGNDFRKKENIGKLKNTNIVTSSMLWLMTRSAELGLVTIPAELELTMRDSPSGLRWTPS